MSGGITRHNRGRHFGYSPYLPSSILELKIDMSQEGVSLNCRVTVLFVDCGVQIETIGETSRGDGKEVIQNHEFEQVEGRTTVVHFQISTMQYIPTSALQIRTTLLNLATTGENLSVYLASTSNNLTPVPTSAQLPQPRGTIPVGQRSLSACACIQPIALRCSNTINR